MLSEEQIFEQFKSRGVAEHFGDLYLPKASSLEFIKACNQNELAVAGVEGFKYEHGKLLPQFDLIADYSSTTAASWSSYRQECNNSAHMFIEESDARENLCFSFTVISHEKLEISRENSDNTQSA